MKTAMKRQNVPTAFFDPGKLSSRRPSFHPIVVVYGEEMHANVSVLSQTAG